MKHDLIGSCFFDQNKEAPHTFVSMMSLTAAKVKPSGWSLICHSLPSLLLNRSILLAQEGVPLSPGEDERGVQPDLTDN